MDPDVYHFVSDNLPPLTVNQRADVAYENNGYKNVYPAFSQRKHQHRTRDLETHDVIAERGMDEEVHGFVEDALPPMTVN